MTKEVLQHTKDCFSLREKERHEFINKRIQPEINKLDNKIDKEKGKIHDRIDKIDDKIEPLKESNILHKANINEMKNTSERIEDKLDKFIEKIEQNMPSKKDVENNAKAIWVLKTSNEKINIKIASVSWWFAVIMYLIDKIF